MSMVKAYHGKKCSDLQLCCSSWLAENKLPGDPLTTDFQMDEEEPWPWESPTACDNADKAQSLDPLITQKYVPLDPPPEFQDSPTPPPHLDKFASGFVSKVIADAVLVSCKITWSIPCSQDCHMSEFHATNNPTSWNGFRLCWTPELLPHKRLRSLSASHNSISTIASTNVDDSSYIKSAVSHDVLTTKQISDMYNVPFDSDIYAVPVDMVRGRDSTPSRGTTEPERYLTTPKSSQKEARARRPRSAANPSSTEPIHVTVEEVRQYLHTLYCNDTLQKGCGQDAVDQPQQPFKSLQNNLNAEVRLNTLKTKSARVFPGKFKKAKENLHASANAPEKFKKCRQSFSTNLKETLCNIFRIRKLPSPDHCLRKRPLTPRSDHIGMRLSGHDGLNPPSPITKPPFSKRALPPLPNPDPQQPLLITHPTPQPPPAPQPPFIPNHPSVPVDFASSIEKVKDYGWYWGPISGEAAEKILSNEPDGSFIVRDSSDDYYIFSLTFKLNSIIRHVRIEHDKGNFSFGSSTRFKSHTIVDFIESAVEHSRSGRYLFFLHRRPVLGPMRVQLLHPVSRFKQVQSLQHMCRFVILKMVRRDLIPYLPLPRRVLDYLSTQHYYAEELSADDRNDSSREDLEQLLPFRQEVFS